MDRLRSFASFRMTIISIPGDIRPELRMTIVCNVEYVLGQQGGQKRKTLRAKVLGGSQKIFWETRKAL